MNSIGQTHSTIVKAILVAALTLPLTVYAVGCKGKKAQSAPQEQVNGPVARLSHLSGKVTDSLPDKVCEEIFGKASLTGEKYLGEISKIPFPVKDSMKASDEDFYFDIDLCALEDKFADDIFLDFEDDIVRDTFALAVKELYDRNTALHYFVSLYELRVSYELFYCDSVSAGKHPSPFGSALRPSEKRLANVFPDRKLRGILSDLLTKVRRSPDYEDNLGLIAASFLNYPYTFESPFDTLRLRNADKNLNEYYDKSHFVSDIKYFQNYYASDDSTALAYEDPVREIASRLNPEMDFDTKCVYAIELSHIMRDEGVDVLGALIESREYSRYLVEVWENWRVNAQASFFGLSNSSVIPNAYYSKIRGICINTILRHIQTHPDDDDALRRLFYLVYEDLYIRRGWDYGNYATPMQYDLRMKGFQC